MRPGFLVNVFVGGIAASVSWGLYGPYTDISIFASKEALIGVENASAALTLKLSSAMGALLIGVGGAKWLTDQMDKKLLRAAASEAAKNEQIQRRLSELLPRKNSLI